jgi:hypothetical protein
MTVKETNTAHTASAPQPVLLVNVFASGELHLNHAPAAFEDIETALQQLQALNGTVWYYRELQHGEKYSEPERVLDLVIEYRLPVMLSNTPDFSTYIDNLGQVVPRNTRTANGGLNDAARDVIARQARKVRKVGLILAILMGLVIAVPNIQRYFEAIDMLANGITTEATIVEKKHWIEKGPNQREFVHDTLVYEFADGTGAKFRNEVSYSPGGFTPVNEGDAIRIIYRTQTPGVNEQRETYQGDASIQGIVFGVLFTMGIVFALVSLFGLLLKLKLKKDLQTPTYGVFTPPE